MNTLKETVKLMRRRAVSTRILSKYKNTGSHCPFLLVDTPEHGNIGDQAIALAEKQLLDKWFGSESYYEITANQINGFEREFAKISPMNQVILVHGGGFLGEIWPNEEYRFRRILDAFSDHKVIVFPQTITFDRTTEKGELLYRESVESWNAHPDLTICCRERQSHDLVEETFSNVRTLLTPDVVLGLKVDVPTFQREGVLLCMRADRERNLNNAAIERLREAIESVLPNEMITNADTVVYRRILPIKRKNEVYAKLAEFAKARLVVTDRLHGMVFAAITGTPCIALDNTNGKVGRVYEWINGLSYLSFCRNVDEAVEAIRCNGLELGTFPLEIYREKLETIRELLVDTTLYPEHGNARAMEM